MSDADRPSPVVVVLGPTATGKSALGMTLARRWGGEIVNADALQVYRGFDLGTAKPTLAERREVRHHLIDVLEPSRRFSAGEFARLARRAIEDVRGRGAVPIVVGGSGLYLRALLEGMSPIPRGDADLRRRLDERLEEDGLEVLYRELGERDPETASRLAPGDRQRILRALEVLEASGRPLSEWIREAPFGERRLDALRIGLTLPRSILYDRISGRVEQMLEGGWVEEVEKMLKQGIEPTVPAFQAIGYRQLVRYLAGEWTLEEAVADIVRATRQYAKRQMTWFRKEKDIRWIPALEAAAALPDLDHAFMSSGGRFLDEQA
jgi:tRNA dimethylallyltransferase